MRFITLRHLLLWQGLRKEGLGVYSYASGARYEGEWRDNVKDGRGVYFYPKVRYSFSAGSTVQRACEMQRVVCLHGYRLCLGEGTVACAFQWPHALVVGCDLCSSHQV